MYQPKTTNKAWLWPVLMVASIGLIDASYLTYKHFAGQFVGCSLQNSCDEVLSSPFSTIGDMPLSMFGALYYALMITLALAAMRGSSRSGRFLKWPAAAAFVASCYLLYLQLAVIHATCEYCLLSFSTVTFLLALTWIGSRRLKRTLNSSRKPQSARTDSEGVACPR